MPLRRLSAQTKCACAAGVRSRIRQSNLLLKHSLLQRIILAKNVVFARIHAT